MTDDIGYQIEQLRRHMQGEPDNKGVLERLTDLERWQSKINAERRTMRALAVGIVIGLGLNGAGIVAILRLLG